VGNDAALDAGTMLGTDILAIRRATKLAGGAAVRNKRATLQADSATHDQPEGNSGT
jgi:hypothetical protein